MPALKQERCLRLKSERMKAFGDVTCIKEKQMNQATPWEKIYSSDEWHEERIKRHRRYVAKKQIGVFFKYSITGSVVVIAVGSVALVAVAFIEIMIG